MHFGGWLQDPRPSSALVPALAILGQQCFAPHLPFILFFVLSRRKFQTVGSARLRQRAERQQSSGGLLSQAAGSCSAGATAAGGGLTSTPFGDWPQDPRPFSATGAGCGGPASTHVGGWLRGERLLELLGALNPWLSSYPWGFSSWRPGWPAPSMFIRCGLCRQRLGPNPWGDDGLPGHAWS